MNVVHEIIQGPTRLTAIDKRAVEGDVAVTRLGLSGDTQCDSRHHGGPDKAVYAYAQEDNDWWSAVLGREIAPGTFGENLTTTGLDITHAVIGERWRIGGRTGPVLEVRTPRSPCGNLSARMGIPRFHQRFDASGRVGAYLRVLREGAVSAGAPIRVVARPDHGVTIAEATAPGEVEAWQRMLDCDLDLVPGLERLAQRVVARPSGRSGRSGRSGQ